jgi:cell division protein ZapE
LRVLCFDELFVNDIGDAMLLGPLLQALIDAGLTLIITSNLPPEHLYRDGFNYARFAPAVDTLQRRLTVIEMDGGRDHRRHHDDLFSRYWVADRTPLESAFLKYLEEGELTTRTPWMLNQRPLPVIQRSERALWTTFAHLCEAPRSSFDYMALCDHFQALFLSSVPALGGTPKQSRIARGTEDAAVRVVAGDRELPLLAAQDDAVRRLIALVDECYDCHRPLYLHAEVPLAQLYTDGHLIAPFQRTVSRLHAMQSWS